MISIIVAVAENGAIGLNNQLIYHIPADMKRFKALTTGNTVIMGRKTFLSLPKGALPNRRNIVLSRNSENTYPGTETFTSVEDAIAHCKSDEKIYIIGGAEIYCQAFPIADELNITLVHDTPSLADTYFPVIADTEWKEVSREDFLSDEKTPYKYSFITYVRN